MKAIIGSLAAIQAHRKIPPLYELVGELPDVVVTRVETEEDVSYSSSCRASLLLLRKRGTGLPVLLVKEYPRLAGGPVRDTYIPAEALLELQELDR